MIAWLKIAFRNLKKNYRRSAITVLTISLGFGAVNLFSGFTEYMYEGNQVVAIHAQANGHLTIFKEGYLERGHLDPARYLLSPDDIHAVEEICRNISSVKLISQQLKISGLVSNGKISTIFIAQGIVPSEFTYFLNQITFLENAKYDSLRQKRFEGKELEDDKTYGVAISRGLARLLELNIGSRAVAFTTTVDGQMNALDIEIFQIVDVGTELMSDKLMRVPLEFARTLFDTEGAERLAVLLENNDKTLPVHARLKREFSTRKLDLEIKTWQEMSQWYRQVKSMFDVIFAFLFTIVFIIVVMSVANTMSMAVLERTREIGTLRSLGLKRNGVILLFSLESSLLGLFGTAGGLVLTFVGIQITQLAELTWMPPGFSLRVPIVVQFEPLSAFFGFIFLIVLCMAASVFPARRAARQNIVDALGHV